MNCNVLVFAYCIFFHDEPFSFKTREGLRLFSAACITFTQVNENAALTVDHSCIFISDLYIRILYICRIFISTESYLTYFSQYPLLLCVAITFSLFEPSFLCQWRNNLCILYRSLTGGRSCVYILGKLFSNSHFISLLRYVGLEKCI